MKNLLTWKLALVAVVLAGGCEARKVGPPPVTVEQYEASRADRATDYPPRTVVLHNLRRVLDNSLSEDQRVASLNLIKQLDRDDPDVRVQLTALLADESNGEKLRMAVLEMLLGKDDPSLSKYAAQILPGLKTDNPMREKILAWLARNPAPGMLAETVQLWAKEKSPTGLNEPRYRQTVERISGKSWDQTLLDAINTPNFQAAEPAVEILVARIPQPRLRSQVVSMTAKTDTVLALQVMIKLFDYFPTTRAAIVSGMALGKVPPVQLEEASRLAADWKQNYGYQFDVRDFYLINMLSRDPMRRNLRRTQLVVELAQSFIKRPHVRRAVPAGTSPGPYGYSDQLSKHVDALTMADLWNLLILNEMVSRPHVQMALKKMAALDQADTKRPWGGLVFYENGKAEAKLYPGVVRGDGDDLVYHPSAVYKKDARSSLCRFYAHFDEVKNAGRAGPTSQELRDAKENNAYGLVLTRISETSFCAHYFNPKGLVISLGVLPLR